MSHVSSAYTTTFVRRHARPLTSLWVRHCTVCLFTRSVFTTESKISSWQQAITSFDLLDLTIISEELQGCQPDMIRQQSPTDSDVAGRGLKKPPK